MLLLASLRTFDPADAVAEVRALLVGVSDYDDTLAITDLAGPPNDVRLMASVLAARGVSDVTILSDAVAGAAMPTHAAIVTAFEALADRARPGDLVLVHFSGHGTQQIDRDGDETDGLDEVFLPVDSAPGPAGSGLIANALVDDEIGRMLDGIRATGADVWLVMDSCHSGSGARAVGDAAVARFVDPEVFGIETGGARDRAGTAPVEDTGGALPGGEIAFYAAQSNELAYEVKFDDVGGIETYYGLFSAKLAARLQAGEAMSYRQLFQAVLNDINGAPGSISVRAQTPLWEGTLGDAPVLGGARGVAVPQFEVDGSEVYAGLVHGFPEGTLLALIADPAAGPEEVLGYAQMEAVQPTTASLRAVGDTCVPRSNALCSETAPIDPQARFARLVSKPVDLGLRLAPPRDLSTGAPLPGTEPLVRALKDAVAEVNAGGNMQVTFDADENSVETAVIDGALWFGSPVQIGETPTGLRWRPGDGPLSELLVRIARAEQTAAMLGAIDSGRSVLNRIPVDIEALASHVPAAALTHPEAFPSIFEECAKALENVSDPAQLGPGARLMPCEQVRLSAQSGRDEIYDLNRVFIDAQYCVSVVHERIEGQAPATGRITEDFTLCNDRCPGGPLPGGQERLFVVVTEAREHGEPLNLTGVLDTCGDTGSRDVGGPAGAFLSELEDGMATRSASLRSGPKKVWVEKFWWWNLPRAELALAGGGR